MRWFYHDGGRAAAGLRGSAQDCVIRSVAIALSLSYREVYANLGRHRPTRNSATKAFLTKLGWEWQPCMGIGTGCQVHLRTSELPSGRLLVAVSKHLTCVIDHVIYDTHNPSRNGTRCVYGYFTGTAPR